jgi:DNA-directed RNA polymerase subunit RPC12/RpoP
MSQYVCSECGGNVRTIGTKKGTKVNCRHCGTESITKEDNLGVDK